MLLLCVMLYSVSILGSKAVVEKILLWSFSVLYLWNKEWVESNNLVFIKEVSERS